MIVIVQRKTEQITFFYEFWFKNVSKDCEKVVFIFVCVPTMFVFSNRVPADDDWIKGSSLA